MLSTEIGDLPRKNPGTGSIGDLKKWNSKVVAIDIHLMLRATAPLELKTGENENEILLTQISVNIDSFTRIAQSPWKFKFWMRSSKMCFLQDVKIMKLFSFSFLYCYFTSEIVT